MKIVSLALAAAAFAVPASAAAPHHCSDDAKAHAAKLLALHFGDFSDTPKDGPAEDTTNQSIGEDVTSVGTIKALKGKGKFDVLEVWGYIYKAEYRMHFIYAQIPDACVLMGQEILENSDPY